jgi:hypothetical protein
VRTGRSATEGRFGVVRGGGRIRLSETVRLQFCFIFGGPSRGTSCNIILDIRQNNTTLRSPVLLFYIATTRTGVFTSRGPWMHRPSGWINKCISCILPVHTKYLLYKQNALTLQHRYGQLQAFQKRGYGKGRFDFDFDFNFTASRSKRSMLLVASNRGSLLMVVPAVPGLILI